MVSLSLLFSPLTLSSLAHPRPTFLGTMAEFLVSGLDGGWEGSWGPP